MQTFIDPNEIIDPLIQKVGKNLKIATPLAAGKANHLLNALYLRAKQDSSIQLTIMTALTLNKPKGKSDLEKRFLEPFSERVFGSYPDLLYEEDRLNQKLPKNIEVVEFYFRAGQFKGNNYAQQNYLSSNYTHVVRDLVARGVNVVCQQVSKGDHEGSEVYSLSCNPDLTRDLVDLLKAEKRTFATLAQVNQDLPFMFGEAIVAPDYFDLVVDNRSLDFPVFAPPKMAVSDADYLIGFHSSSLVRDDGEIQIGIGSLGDALVYALCLRQEQNEKYRVILNTLEINEESFPVIQDSGSFEVFNKGLFAATEMLVDSFADLYKHGILKKKVFDSVILQRLLNEGKIKKSFGVEIFKILFQEKAILAHLNESDFYFLQEFGIIRPTVHWREGQIVLESGKAIEPDIFKMDLEQIIGDRLRNGAIAHAGFFLGPRAFYDFLKDLPVAERKLFRMRRISQINQLYGHEEVDRLQRINGRFINTCMKVTLNGSANSDALEDATQISGVGGQYNFVAMAHELPRARSILQLRSTRTKKNGIIESNIVFSYGNCTIPRHLRDIVVTEYGIADLRGKTDEEVVIELIQIADSRFQHALIAQAQKAGKLSEDFRLAPRFCHNRPERYTRFLKQFKKEGLFKPFPLGTDLTEVEMQLGKSLKQLKKRMNHKLGFFLFVILSLALKPDETPFVQHLRRMALENPKNLKEKIYKRLVLKALSE